MKVSNDKNLLAKNLENKNADKAGSAKAKTLEQNLGKDLKTDIFKAKSSESSSVDLSTRAQDMKKAKELATNAPDVRAEKLAKLREAIDSGTYKVDSQKVADKLVNDELMNSAALGE